MTALVVGVILSIVDVRTRTVSLAMPVPVQIVWQYGLAAAGGGGLVALTWPTRLSTALGLELGALMVLGTVTGMYAMALLAINGMQAVTSGSFLAAVAVGSGWRSVQIFTDLYRLAKAGPGTAPAPPGAGDPR